MQIYSRKKSNHARAGVSPDIHGETSNDLGFFWIRHIEYTYINISNEILAFLNVSTRREEREIAYAEIIL